MSGDVGPLDPDPDHSEAELDRLLDALIAADVLLERPDGTLATTDEFERTRGIYHSTYGDSSEATFRQSVASTFDLAASEAERRIESEGVTRGMYVDYLSVRSHADGEHPRADLARMAMLVGDIAPDTPIPEGMEELDDDSYGSFLAGADRAAVFVWKRNCAPCDRLKDDLGDVLAALPGDVAVAGVDGESVDAFRREFGVEAAPSVFLFADGEVQERLRGYVTAEEVEAAAGRAYGPD